MRKPSAFFYRFSIVACFAIGCYLVLVKVNQPWHTLYCSVIQPLTTWRPKVTELRNCSSVHQKILDTYTSNVLIEDQPDHPGWQAITNKDKSLPATFRLRAKLDRDSVVFYPRVSGASTKIEVYEINNQNKRLLFQLKGTEGEWTGVGDQYVINLGCSFFGHSTLVDDVVLEFVVSGNWPQIWLSSTTILY